MIATLGGMHYECTCTVCTIREIYIVFWGGRCFALYSATLSRLGHVATRWTRWSETYFEARAICSTVQCVYRISATTCASNRTVSYNGVKNKMGSTLSSWAFSRHKPSFGAATCCTTFSGQHYLSRPTGVLHLKSNEGQGGGKLS